MKTSNYSTVLTVTTDPLGLDAPILDAMGTITYNSAVINWLPVDNAEGYRIYLENTDDTLVILDDLDVSNVTTYNLTGLYQNINYQYKVKAYYNLLESSYSVTDDFVTADFVINAPTFNANSDLNQFGLTLNWNVVSNATAYLIHVENLDISSVVMNDVNIGNVLTYTLDTLDSVTNYRVKLKAYNPIETSVYSSNNNFTTFDPVPEFSPTMLTSTDITQTSIKFRWTSVTYADTYALEVYDDIGLTNLVFSESGIVATEKNVTGLTSGTTYYARTNATNESGSSTWSSANTTNTLAYDLQSDSNTTVIAKFNNNYTNENVVVGDLSGVNSPTFTTALLSGDTNSLQLDGINQVVIIPNGASTSRDISIRALFKYLSFTRANTHLYSEWYGQSSAFNYIAKIMMEYDKSNNRFLIYLYDEGYGATPNNNQYIALATSTITLNTSDKYLIQFSWDNTNKIAEFAINGTNISLTTVYISLPYSILTTATLNLNDSIAPKIIYWGGLTYPDILDPSLSPNMILGRLFVDSTKRTFAQHEIDYNNISSRL